MPLVLTAVDRTGKRRNAPRAEVVGGEGHVAPLNGAYRLFTDIGDRPAYRQPPGEWPQLLWSLPRTAFQSPETFPQV